MTDNSSSCRGNVYRGQGYNLFMRSMIGLLGANLILLAVVLVVVAGTAVLAQNSVPGADAPVTVPIALDQGRVVIDVDLLLPKGSTERVRGWVDNGNPNLYMTQRIAKLMGVGLSCDGQNCSGTAAPRDASLQIAIGGMKISLAPAAEGNAGKIKVPVGASALAPGMSAEINIPSSILRSYDVVINFTDRELTIGLPGRVKFNGAKSKMLVTASNGLIRVPSKIENKNLDLGLDLGSSASFLSEELFDKLSGVHSEWPRVIGAVGPFNSGESDSELKLTLTRVDRVQYGPLFLTDVAVAATPKDHENRLTLFEQRAGVATAGLLSAEALMNYRVGLDYAHSTVYFDIGRTARFPDFDVVGLILRPEGDSGFVIAGVADFDGQPSVPVGQVGIQVGDHLVAVGDTTVAELTLGQVWALLEGSPGQERKLTLVRAGKQFIVIAKVQHFLGDAARNDDSKGKSKRN